jgi:ribosome-associated translation inhibitor RaiA
MAETEPLPEPRFASEIEAANLLAKQFAALPKGVQVALGDFPRIVAGHMLHLERKTLRLEREQQLMFGCIQSKIADLETEVARLKRRLAKPKK